MSKYEKVYGLKIIHLNPDLHCLQGEHKFWTFQNGACKMKFWWEILKGVKIFRTEGGTYLFKLNPGIENEEIGDCERQSSTKLFKVCL